MDEDWRNTFGILMWSLGSGPGGVNSKGPKFICTNIAMLHIKSKVMKSRKHAVQKFSRGQKVGF